MAVHVIPLFDTQVLEDLKLSHADLQNWLLTVFINGFAVCPPSYQTVPIE
jgi:hypothetical protein